MNPEAKLEAMGLQLPEVPKPVAAYVPAVRSGSYVYVSGQLPLAGGQLTAAGKLGAEITLDQGYQAARTCVLNCLAAVKSQAGSLDRVVRVVKLTGFVASSPGFTQQPQVVNGASELLLEVFGDRGRHARAAVGVAELPLSAAVEIDLVVEVSDS